MTTRKRTETAPTRAPFAMPKPERTGPLRLISTVGRFDDAQLNPDGTSAGRGRPLGSTKDVIEHAIRVAQEVIDQQIGSGERILRYLRRAPIGKRRVSPLAAKSGASLTERTIEITDELGVLAIEALETLAESKTVVDVITKWLGLGAASSAIQSIVPSVPTPAGPRANVFVSSHKPARGEARLTSPLPGDPWVPGLHCPDAPAIVSIEYLGKEEHAFRVSVPEAQPAGVYHGVILSRASDDPLGTMMVTISNI